MKKYVQIDKETKRVICYSSNSANSQEVLEIEIDSEENKELLKNPFIYTFNESNNSFIKDTEYQNKLIKEKENKLSDSKKIDYLTKQLATEKLESMKKDLTMKMLIQQQAQNKLEIMKLKGSN